MPPCPIIDSHVHLWDPRRFRMPWTDGLDALNKPFGPAEFRQHTEGVEVEAIVYLEVDVAPSYRLLEAQWVEALAAEEPRIQAIVAAAPVEDGAALRSYLEALVAIGSRVKGVRRLVQDEPDAAFCLRPGFVEGIRLLPEYSLSFDICIRHWQLASATELVRRCPQTSFILDHLGKPDIKNGLLEPWREQLRELAALPNVVCKISGMVTEADHATWTADDLRPYVEHTLECFGPARVLFGGDWPVATLASSYLRWVETLDSLTAHMSEGAQRKLWADNARRVYRI